MSNALQNPAPTGLTARYQGQGNSTFTTTFYYWIQALYTTGWSALSVSANTGAYCPAALTGGNIANVQWSPAPGALAYLLYRSTSSTAPGYGATGIFIATSETGFKDDGSISTFTQTPRYDAISVARMIYDFATDGGVHTAAIVPAVSDTIPAGAIVLGGVIYCKTTLAGPTNMTLGTTAGSAANSILTTTAVPSAGAVIVPTSVATPFLMSAAGQLNLTITVADATAGRLEVNVFYIQTV
jgi:hypothetical protein